jgi:threonine/homoserine/homoserine lactone efflux protein
MSLEFLLTTLVVVISPGTGAIFTLATGLSRGGRASLVAALGCTLGVIPHLLASIFGLAVLLHASATAFEIFKYAGAVFLLFIAWNTWRETGALRIEPEGVVRNGRQVIVHAVLINLLNPKLSIFFLAFLPQFVRADVIHPIADMLGMSAVFMALTFIVFAVYGILAAQARDWLMARPDVMAWLRRSFALAFAGLGLKLLLAER